MLNSLIKCTLWLHNFVLIDLHFARQDCSWVKGVSYGPNLGFHFFQMFLSLLNQPIRHYSPWNKVRIMIVVIILRTQSHSSLIMQNYSTTLCVKLPHLVFIMIADFRTNWFILYVAGLLFNIRCQLRTQSWFLTLMFYKEEFRTNCFTLCTAGLLLSKMCQLRTQSCFWLYSDVSLSAASPYSTL